MKTNAMLMIAALAAVPTAGLAQSDGAAKTGGFHVGVEATRDSNGVRQPGAATTVDRQSRGGFGVRGFAGYDLAIGETVVIGAEAGIGKGGRTVDQRSLGGGRYRVDPGLSYDATGRIGIVPTAGLMLYGRAGYRWLETKRDIVGQTLGNARTKLTEKGFTYGGGAEVSVTNGLSLRAEFNRTNYDPNFRQNKVSVGALVKF